MEFVLVTYPAERRVNVDDSPLGKTGKLLIMEKGTHTFDLGKPLDYTPASQTVLVARTSRTKPMIIMFLPIVVPVADEDDAASDAEVVSVTSTAAQLGVGVKTAKRVGRQSAGSEGVPASAKKSGGKAAKKSATKKSSTKIAKKSAKKGTKRVAKKAAKKSGKKAAKKSKRTAKKTRR